MSLRALLEAACAAEVGRADRYASAAELTARLMGTWYSCQAESIFEGVGVTFMEDGGYTSLRWNDAGDDLVSFHDPPWIRGISYLAFLDPDAGIGADSGGQTSTEVKLHDPAPRSGLFIYVASGSKEPDLVITAEFDKDPRRFMAVEPGPRPARDVLVPVPRP